MASDVSRARITVDVEWPTQSTPGLEEDITVRSMEHFEDYIARTAPDFGGKVTKIYGEWLEPDEIPGAWECDECAATIVGPDSVSPMHDDFCSLHPNNQVAT